jgi:hypothetical protein
LIGKLLEIPADGHLRDLEFVGNARDPNNAATGEFFEDKGVTFGGQHVRNLSEMLENENKCFVLKGFTHNDLVASDVPGDR